jgi:pilus assembly protein Flp/PilA
MTPHLLRRFLRDEDGSTAIEYALIAAILGIGLVASLTSMGGDLNTLLTNVNDRFPQ